MAKQLIDPAALEELGRLAPHVAKLPVGKLWLDYDREADVLYVSFRRPQQATDSEMRENGVLVRFRRDEIVGVTILDASKRSPPDEGAPYGSTRASTGGVPQGDR